MKPWWLIESVIILALTSSISEGQVQINPKPAFGRSTENPFHQLPGNPDSKQLSSTPRKIQSQSITKTNKVIDDGKKANICRSLVKKFAVSYASLTKWVDPSLQIPKDNPGKIVSLLNENDCSKERQTEAIRKIALAINENSRKIGVILPLSGPFASVGNDLLNGIKMSARQNGFDFTNQVIVKDSHGDANTGQRALAELVFIHNVSAVVGGLHSPVAQALQPWADNLGLPIVLLSSNVNISEKSKMSFKVFPDQRELAFALAETCKMKGFKRVAFIYPTGVGAETIIQYMEDELRARNIAVIKKANYQSTDYSSMENAARTILQQHSAGREKEFRELVLRGRKKAQSAGVPFSPRMIVLPPIIDFDAVFLPDNFKNVHHLARIFQYLGVKSLPMFGNHEWRSMALVSPYEEFLNGAFFADFIGSYKDLPSSLEVELGTSPYFVKAEKASVYDFNLIGMRAFSILARSITSHAKRRKFVEYLTKMEDYDSTYFKQGPVFKENHQSHWPAFIFSVQNRNIFLTTEYRRSNMPPIVSSPPLAPSHEKDSQASVGPPPKIGSNTQHFPGTLFSQ